MKPPDEHIPSIKTVLPFYLVAAVGFVLFHILLLLSADVLPRHYFQPRLLALTHLFVLGWATMIIFGASNQLVPVISETRLHSNRLPVSSLILLIAGIPMLTGSFWLFRFSWPAYTGSACILIAIIIHAFNIYRSISKGKSSIITDIMLMAHGWLLITATIGLLLLVNLVFPLFPEEHLHYLKIHAPIGMAGWFLQLVIAVSSRLVPMFTLSRNENTKPLNITFYTLNAGLALFLVEGMVFQSFHGKHIYFLLIAIGIGSYILYIRNCYQTAMRRQHDAGMKQTFIALFFIMAALIILGIILWPGLDFPPNITTVLGLTFFCGLISTIIMGQTFKTLPFIIWMHVTKPNTLPDIMPKNLYKERWVTIQMWVYLPGLLLLLTGLLFNVTVLLCGTILTLVAAIIYMVHVFYIAVHLKNKQQ